MEKQISPSLKFHPSSQSSKSVASSKKRQAVCIRVPRVENEFYFRNTTSLYKLIFLFTD
ncbi:MAG: hypothetical protein LBQ31_07655 [Bacteroidales bacterium]|nr:hypothetical protein [Bacteroidales bacterium]